MAKKQIVGAGRTESSITADAKRIKVRAVRTGYYDHIRRRPGDVFVIDEKHFSDAHREPTEQRPHLLPGWMEKVARNTPETTTTAQEALNAEMTAQAAKANATSVTADVL